MKPVPCLRLSGLLLLGVTIGVILASCSSSRHAQTPVQDQAPILTSSEPSIFPESWQRPPISASGAALDAGEFERARRVVRRALAKYPEAVQRAHLKHVYVLAELRYSGIVTSGTNSRTAVYLKVGEPRRGFTDAHIERTFHAEFSSILLRNRPADFDAEAWLAVNPPDFVYLGTGVDAVKQRKAGLTLSDTLHQEGFLREYSRSTMENDVNGFAAMMFTGDPALWDIASRFPRIRAKLDLMLRFFQKLDPVFDEAYFRALRAR